MPQQLTLKSCMPVLDSLTSGYLILTSQDLGVTQNEDGPFFSWESDDKDIIKVTRRNDPTYIPLPKEYSDIHFAWNVPFFLQLPSGYSAVVTHPLNRHDVPFITHSAIVDMDAIMPNGHYPFAIRKDFVGIIPAGTPIAQILPFKRESWKKEFSEELKNNGDRENFLRRRQRGRYKKVFWNKKEYN